MALTILRRVFLSRSMTNPLLLSQRSGFSTSKASIFSDHDPPRSVADRLQLSPLFRETREDDMRDCRIELVDDSTWNVSSSLADAWRGSNEAAALRMMSRSSDQECLHDGDSDEKDRNGGVVDEGHDFDEIEDLRIRGNLFYKLDQGSKEYEEYKFDFHRRGSKEGGKRESSNRASSTAAMASKKDSTREIKMAQEKDCMREMKKIKNSESWPHQVRDVINEKKQRTPTFNQLTAAYHEPFCLDVYISKGSVRASIIHRATSNVVAVAHSISKDMKFDLGSTKNKNTCAAVGKVLAQRALADDIHNVVFTPRKGERLEGKLQIVVKSIVAGGVDVKVKLKQTRLKQVKHIVQKSQHQHRL